MRTLYLTIKKQWFDLILSGEKKEEYRDIKGYWIKRLRVPVNTGAILFQNYSYVQFTNGYGKDKPTAIFECLGITIGKGNPKLGAPREDVFIIKMGKEISRSNL